MNETSFWQLIDQAGNQEEPNEWLRDALLKKEINEIVDFEFMLQTFIHAQKLSVLTMGGSIHLNGRLFGRYI
ncbi:DUF4240 domain-containing protein [Bacillus subtilis]|uniref:DUF4240 domain-containing protein n=1 Tax=Bacillus subtilis TaxID=1423 RepID=UPI002DB8DBA5|nr:DUF4240 domain-containing protein [Bacillus subtilis]MEC0365304.1 DUF4240 domain-containing protein [Bacillus subtilis]MEC0400516.1 DUF4240 domain-containing protein [Bacillus subtilis]